MGMYALGSTEPRVHPEAFVHPEATVIGDVVVGARASVWPAAVLRGDYGHIEVREGSSVQDGTVVHAGPDLPTIIGPFAVVGHNAHLEGCVIAPWALVGSGATVLHRSVVRSHAIVGAGAVVPHDTQVPERSLAVGVPCAIRPDRVPEFANRPAVETYIENAARCRLDLRPVHPDTTQGVAALEAIGSARATRWFRPDDVAEDLLDTLVWAATRADSAHDSQPWDLVVIRRGAVRDAIAAAVAASPRAHDPVPAPETGSDDHIDRGVSNPWDDLGGAPALILVCARNCYPAGAPDERFLWSALGAAAQNLMVAARSLGLGVAPTTVHVFAEPEIRRVVQLPRDRVIGFLAPVGWPARPFGWLERRPLQQVVHHDRW